MRSPASARFTASTDTPRLTPSGATVIGSTTEPRSGTTGNSDGSGAGCCVSATALSLSASDLWRRALGDDPRGSRGQPGHALQFGEIKTVGVVLRRVVIGM
jgi:hypothetical protein